MAAKRRKNRKKKKIGIPRASTCWPHPDRHLRSETFLVSAAARRSMTEKLGLYEFIFLSLIFLSADPGVESGRAVRTVPRD